GVVVDEPHLLLQALQRAAADAGRAAAHAELRELRAGAHEDREGPRRDLGVERPPVAALDAIELDPAVGDDAGEDVEPARRALGVREGRVARREVEPLLQRHDVDAAPLEHRALAEVDLVAAELSDAALD